MNRKLFLAVVISVLSSISHADGVKYLNDAAAKAAQQGLPFRLSTKIFSQAISIRIPKGFEAISSGAKKNYYLQEWVPVGEEPQSWSQMVSLTGIKGASRNPKMEAKLFTGFTANQFKKACPNSFAAAAFGEFKLSGHDAFMAVISCGNLASTGASYSTTDGKSYSETLMHISIKGINDLYSVQWAERGAASTTPLQIDAPKWLAKAKQLRIQLTGNSENN